MNAGKLSDVRFAHWKKKSQETRIFGAWKKFSARDVRRCCDATACQTNLSVIRKVGLDIREGRTTAQDVTRAYLAKIRQTDEKVGSFITTQADNAIAQAISIDEKICRGEDPGILTGVAFAIKDNICSSDSFTTAGSRLLEVHQSPHDSLVVSAIKAEGGIILGKTNLDEFGMGSTTENSAFGVTSNPWDMRRIPGGSSGGSASAVALKQCAAALGSDTGGSIRQPASFCGVVGLKPTYGLLSRHGLVAYASSFDTIGPVTTSVEDSAIVLTALCSRHNQLDSTLHHTNSSRFHDHLKNLEHFASKPLSGYRFAIIKETIGLGVQHDVVQRVLDAATKIERLGAAVDFVSCPTFHLGLPAYYILALSEASSNLSRYDCIRLGGKTSRDEGFGAEVKRRILMGSFALSAGHSDAYYERAQEVQRMVEAELACKLQEYDAFILPAAPSPAYLKSEKMNDPLAMYSGDMMTVNVNLSGLPAIVVRGGHVENDGTLLPVGLQIVGRPFGERALLEIAHAYELCTWDEIKF